MSERWQQQFERLMTTAKGRLVDRHLAHLILGPRFGKGCLPLDLGLGPVRFWQFVQTAFPGAESWLDREFEPSHLMVQRSNMRVELKALRADESEDLVGLLSDYCVGEAPTELPEIVATACLGSDHLWQDLGFTGRDMLSELMSLAFPELKALNDRDMKWKRFFYKQLCERGGGYVCRAPSCDQCAGYAECFGPEV